MTPQNPSLDPSLDPDDVTELGEMLEFLHDWLTGPDTELLAASLRRFVGTDGYDLAELGTDLARFTFLLGTDDGTQLFGTVQPNGATGP
jgi:hypothetical protein